MNGMTAGRGSKAILDEWAALGNEGWGWDDLQEYYRKVRSFSLSLPLASPLHAFRASSFSFFPIAHCLSLPAQTWKLTPPPNDDYGRTYDPSLYSETGGPGHLGYNNYNVESVRPLRLLLLSILRGRLFSVHRLTASSKRALRSISPGSSTSTTVLTKE
jgi:hypothetical protein